MAKNGQTTRRYYTRLRTDAVPTVFGHSVTVDPAVNCDGLDPAVFGHSITVDQAANCDRLDPAVFGHSDGLYAAATSSTACITDDGSDDDVSAAEQSTSLLNNTLPLTDTEFTATVCDADDDYDDDDNVDNRPPNDHTYCIVPPKTVSNISVQKPADKNVLPQDHQYFVKDSPRFLKRKLNDTHARIVMQRKRQKLMQQKIRRLKKKVRSLSDIVTNLKEGHLISDNGADVLAGICGDFPTELLSRMDSNIKTGKATRKQYSPTLKKFALTLNFYSPKAYRYVRDTFNLALPHPSVLQSWYKSVDGEPGFNKEVLDVLSQHVQEARSSGKNVLCNLTVDEMAIHKQIAWDGTRFRGYVDIGTEVDDDSLPAASEALVFMLVALDASWKMPIAYFLITGLSGIERANLVLQALRKLHTIGVIVTSITCDGASSNQTMFAELGVKIQKDKREPWFTHPSDLSRRVYVILDVCHMLKLLRNTFATQILVNKDGQNISWQYVESLHQLQVTSGLRAGNKIRKAHMEWQKQKMKVNLAAQTLSTSVADAIQFCADQKISRFEGCEATVDFIRRIDRLFDILNSRNPLGKYSKAPLRLSNRSRWYPFLMETRTYLLSMRNESGTVMTSTNRKTAFIGFVLAIDSVIGLFNDLVAPTTSPPLQYLLTYKLSQDHLELFFGCISLRGGCNNNPTATQFVAAYKRLMIHHDVKVNTGNCQLMEFLPLLSASSISNRNQMEKDSAQTIAKNMLTYTTEGE